MAWLLFEVLLAFGVALFIVWWTFPKETRADADNKAAEQDSAGAKGGEGQ